MIDILNHIDDLKKVKKMIEGGLTQDAIKACDVAIAHHQKSIEEFEKWAEEESKRDYTPEHIKQQQDPRHNQEPFK